MQQPGCISKQLCLMKAFQNARENTSKRRNLEAYFTFVFEKQ